MEISEFWGGFWCVCGGLCFERFEGVVGSAFVVLKGASDTYETECPPGSV